MFVGDGKLIAKKRISRCRLHPNTRHRPQRLLIPSRFSVETGIGVMGNHWFSVAPFVAMIEIETVKMSQLAARQCKSYNLVSVRNLATCKTICSSSPIGNAWRTINLWHLERVCRRGQVVWRCGELSMVIPVAASSGSASRRAEGTLFVIIVIVAILSHFMQIRLVLEASYNLKRNHQSRHRQLRGTIQIPKP